MGLAHEGRTASPVQTLMVAWTIVVGLAFAPVLLFARDTGKIELLIAFLGAALVIGVSLLIALGLSRMGRARRAREEGNIANLSRRGGVFGKR